MSASLAAAERESERMAGFYKQQQTNREKREAVRPQPPRVSHKMPDQDDVKCFNLKEREKASRHSFITLPHLRQIARSWSAAAILV
jgi:hypothetical protein